MLRSSRGAFENQLAQRLLSPDPGWFIDLGAGYGRLYPLYARPGRKVVLVDYAPNLIAQAAHSLGDQSDVSFIVANAYHLPFRPGVFSAGLSVRTFHHMSAPERFLGECARVFEPGGHMVVEYSNKRNILRGLPPLPRGARYATTTRSTATCSSGRTRRTSPRPLQRRASASTARWGRGSSAVSSPAGHATPRGSQQASACSTAALFGQP